MIRNASNLRVGAAQKRVVGLSRDCIKNNTTNKIAQVRVNSPLWVFIDIWKGQGVVISSLCWLNIKEYFIINYNYNKLKERKWRNQTMSTRSLESTRMTCWGGKNQRSRKRKRGLVCFSFDFYPFKTLFKIFCLPTPHFYYRESKQGSLRSDWRCASDGASWASDSKPCIASEKGEKLQKASWQVGVEWFCEPSEDRLPPVASLDQSLGKGRALSLRKIQ